MPEPLPEPPLTLPALLRRNREASPGKPAVIADGGDSVTHAGLDDKSRALAARLVAAGVRKGSRVGLIMPNGAGWAVAAVAVMRIGATLVPLSTLLRPPELAAQLRIAAVTDLIAVPEFRQRRYLEDLERVVPGILAATASGTRHAGLPFLRHVWPGDGPPDPAQSPRALIEALEDAVRPADDLAIIFTSGSKGAPKGVIHTHGNAIRATTASLDSRTLRPEDRLYIPMPFFWTGGFATGLMSMLVAGATLLTEAEPDPERTLAFLERERATLFRGWPDQAARIAAHPAFATADLSSLRPGSLQAVLPPAVRGTPGSRASLLGMTETFGPYSGARLDLDLSPGEHGSCGKPFDGVELRIIDPGTGCEAAPGEPGEIRLRGPNLMRGICGRLREETFDADGFYPTGDLGSVDAAGYLWFRGRLDDMFKVRGATVYPAEVEAALRGIDGVREAYVTSVPGNRGTENRGTGNGGPGAGGTGNGETGDGGTEVGAVVVSARSAPDLAAAAAARLSSFKVPAWWAVLAHSAEVPRLASDKVDMAGVRELLAKQGQRHGKRR